MPTADELLTSLEDKQAQQRELQKKLRHSLLIEQLIPDAFAFGSCKVGGRSSLAAPDKGTITFRRGDDSVVEMPAMEVPYELWPAGLKNTLDEMRDQRRAKAIKTKLGVL